MLRQVHVHFLPELFEPEELRGGTAVVIDVLRASTTIVHALAAGAKAVRPFLSVDEVWQEAKRHVADTIVTGGERNGRHIDGFDLDNSPLRYTPDQVRDKIVLLTTTNGTRALDRCHSAQRILIGAFVNLGAVVAVLQVGGEPVHLVCAGTDGRITTEDVLFAGVVAARLRAALPGVELANDEAQIAATLFAAQGDDRASLVTALRASRGGRNLVELGFDADIERSAECDRFDFVPEYFPSSRQIIPARRAG
jgi:2-phosphosulfolactate phosphatase